MGILLLLGDAAGSTPLPAYRELVGGHRDGRAPSYERCGRPTSSWTARRPEPPDDGVWCLCRS
jgi:hypothetical protein